MTPEELKDILDPITRVLSKMDEAIGLIGTRLENIGTRLENIETRLENIETDVADVKRKIDLIDVFYIGGIHHLRDTKGPFRSYAQK